MQRNAAFLAGRKAACVLPDVLTQLSTFLPSASSHLDSSTQHRECTSTISFSHFDLSKQSPRAHRNRAMHGSCCHSAPLGRAHAHLAAAEATTDKRAAHGPSPAEVARTLLQISGRGILSTTRQNDTSCSTCVTEYATNCLLTRAQSGDNEHAWHVCMYI